LACLIDLSEWETFTLGGKTERVTYLSFTKGKKDVSNYFLNFIDCNNKNTHFESTARLIAALDEFSKQYDLSPEDKIQRRESVYNYCKQKSRGGEVLLESISALFYPEDPSLFRDFASDERFKVGSVISIDTGQMRELKYVKYKSDSFTIEFDSELVVNKKILLDANGRLIIKELPESLIAKIKSLQNAE
jgi:nucleoid-associated protein YejK